MLLAFAILAWIGGSDTERILYWSAPIVYILIGKSLEKRVPFPAQIWVLLVGITILSERIVFILSEKESAPSIWPPFITLLSNKAQIIELFTASMPNIINFILLFQYTAIAVALGYLISKLPTRRVAEFSQEI